MEHFTVLLLWALAIYGIYIAIRLWMITLAFILLGLILTVPIVGFFITFLAFSIYDIFKQKQNGFKQSLKELIGLIVLFPILKASLLCLAIWALGYLAVNSSAPACNLNIRFC